MALLTCAAPRPKGSSSRKQGKKRDDLDAAQEPQNNCHIAGKAVVGTAMARGYLARHLAARDAYQKHTLSDTVAGDQARYRLSRYKLCSE